MASEKVIALTAANFANEVLEAPQTVIVDFWAEWCGPCRMLGPVIDQIAQEQPGFKVCKMDVEENKAMAAQYGVMSIPTVVIFREGEEVTRMVGVNPKEKIIEAAKS